MQLLLQNFLSFEDAYEKAQLKKPKDEKARMFFMANIIFALFDYSILKNSYHYQQIKWIFSYELRPLPRAPLELRASLTVRASQQLRASQSLRAPVVLSGWEKGPFGAFIGRWNVETHIEFLIFGTILS